MIANLLLINELLFFASRKLNVIIFVKECVRVCLRPPTVKASSVWNSWDCEGTDQRCCVEDVGFLCRFPSSLLWNAEPNLSAGHFILFLQ